MRKIDTKDDLKKQMEVYHEHHIYYDVISDIDTIGTDDVRIWSDQEKDFLPGTILHFCRKCDCMMTFYSYNVGHKDVSTYEMNTVVNDTPMIMYRKIYRCSCGREFITATMVFERVGYNLEYGLHPIDFEKYFDKKGE